MSIDFILARAELILTVDGACALSFDWYKHKVPKGCGESI